MMRLYDWALQKVLIGFSLEFTVLITLTFVIAKFFEFARIVVCLFFYSQHLGSRWVCVFSNDRKFEMIEGFNRLILAIMTTTPMFERQCKIRFLIFLFILSLSSLVLLNFALCVWKRRIFYSNLIIGCNGFDSTDFFRRREKMFIFYALRG